MGVKCPEKDRALSWHFFLAEDVVIVQELDV